MPGEKIDEIFIGYSGFVGDRLFAFKNSNARKGFPYINSTVNPQMLLYKPQFRHFEKTIKPPNFIEAKSIAPGVNPQNAEPDALTMDVITPSGNLFPIDDPKLIEMLKAELKGENNLTLLHSDRPLTDCRLISMIGLQTINQVQREMNRPIDKRRFWANIYLSSDNGFSEYEMIGRRLRIGTE